MAAAPHDLTTNVWDNRTPRLNRESLLTFFLDMALLVVFAFVDVPFHR